MLCPVQYRSEQSCGLLQPVKEEEEEKKNKKWPTTYSGKQSKHWHDRAGKAKVTVEIPKKLFFSPEDTNGCCDTKASVFLPLALLPAYLESARVYESGTVSHMPLECVPSTLKSLVSFPWRQVTLPQTSTEVLPTALDRPWSPRRAQRFSSQAGVQNQC